MANAPFSGDFESLARQYWNTWNELLGARSGGAFDSWGLFGGMPPGLGRMDPGAYDWYQRMQRLAADFSGGGRAVDIASAWRDMLGGQAHAAEPFAGMLRSMHGGLAGGDWLEQMRPLLDMLLRPLRQQGADWLQRPAFGPAREHQERLQALARAWQQWEERNEAFTALLAQAGQGAFERFERLLEQHDAPGKRLESARALFDLWIDAAEEAWAEIAMSAEYRHAYAEMTNALMRLRLGLQREVEQFGAMLGLPGRSELDALHRKVADLERSLHAARRAAAKPAAARPDSRPAQAAVADDNSGPADAGKAAVAARPQAPAKASRAKPRKRKPLPAGRDVRPSAKAKKAPARKPAARRVAADAAATAKPAPARSRRRAVAAKAPAAKAVVATRAPGKAMTDPRKPAAPRRAPVKVAARSAPQASTATARKTRVAKVPKPGAAAAKHVPPAKATPAPAPVKVVSMKDWVSRNLSAAHADAPSRGKKAKR
jgi:class III poly(R)-hydroxyalkanoic acid synthase PhaE subunit